jgi:hypothetical protein
MRTVICSSETSDSFLNTWCYSPGDSTLNIFVSFVVFEILMQKGANTQELYVMGTCSDLLNIKGAR